MKKFSLFTTLLFAAALAQADVTIEQKIESAVINGTSVYKIKGDMMRIDVPAPGIGQMSTIVDMTKGKSTTLMPAQKMAMQMDLNAIKQQAQALGKAEKPKSTGEKQKIGDWNAEAYEFNMGGMKFKAWVAKDFPNGAAIKQQMDKLSKATVGSGVDLSQFDLPGVVVKTEMTSPQMNLTSTLLSVKEGPVADSEFAIPADFQVMALPGAAAAPDAGS